MKTLIAAQFMSFLICGTALCEAGELREVIVSHADEGGTTTMMELWSLLDAHASGASVATATPSTG